MSRRSQDNRARKILARDGYICYICNKKIISPRISKYRELIVDELPKYVKWKCNLGISHKVPAATIDHVIPRCLKGLLTNHPNNLRACCYHCNNKKSHQERKINNGKLVRKKSIRMMYLNKNNLLNLI